MSARRPALACLLAACTAPPPEPQVIRLPVKQDLCDGLTERPCYSGPADTAGVGRCRAGVQRCDPLLGWRSPCDGEALPRGETCSTPDDDDCDGHTTCEGELLWARSITGGGQDTGGTFGAELSAFTVDPTGRLWLAGTFEGQLDFGGLALRSESLPDDLEPYLVHFDAQAAHPAGLTFGRAVGKRDEHRIYDLQIAPDGDLFLLLWTDARVEFSGQSAGSVKTPNVLAHLGPDASPRRVKALPLARNDIALQLAVTATTVAITGIAEDHSTFLDGDRNQGSFLLALDRPTLTPRRQRYFPSALTRTQVAPLADDLIVTGQFTGELALADSNHRCPTSACAAVLRLDAAGEPQWLRAYGLTGASSVDALIADDNGITLAGTTQQIDLGGGPLGDPEGFALYIARLTPAGDHVWSRSARSGGRLTVTALAPGPAGSVYLGGDYSDGLKLGPYLLGARRIQDNWPTSDVFLARYSATGTAEWAQFIAGPGFQELGGLALRATDGALVVAGTSSLEFTLGDTPMPGRVFLAAIKP